MNISKSKIEVYKIRDIKLGGWADISIDAHENTGRISISSSHGDWSYYWGSCGCVFKEFLCNLNIGYAANKFRCSNHFDLEATVISWKRSVLEQRRDENLESEEARELFNEIKEIHNEHPNMEGAKHMMYHTENLLSFFITPDFVTGVSPLFVFFWDNIWQPFTKELQNESIELV